MLYEDVVDWVLQLLFNRGTDPGYGWGELEERRRGVGWMPINWVAVWYYIGESDVGTAR